MQGFLAAQRDLHVHELKKFARSLVELAMLDGRAAISRKLEASLAFANRDTHRFPLFTLNGACLVSR